MSLKALTANTAPEENAHILAEDDAAIFQSMFGEDGVLEIGQRMKATVISNNKVRVADGLVCIGGHIARTVYGDYTDLTIENGESGKNRNDLIIGTFSTTGAGGIDTMQLTVKKGAAGTAATDPALTQGNLYTGSKLREVPLWRVKIEGLSITKVEQLFEIVPSIPTLKKELESLNRKSIIESGENDNGSYIKFGDGTLFMWGNTKIKFTFASGDPKFGEFYVSRSYTRNFPVESLVPCTVQAIPYNNSYSLLLLTTFSLNKKDFTVKLIRSSGSDFESIICWQAIGRWR